MGHLWYKVSVEFQCGHVKHYTVYSLDEAARYEAQGARQVCGECLEATEWPQLVGTPKQISLAREIRRAQWLCGRDLPYSTEQRAVFWITNFLEENKDDE